MSSATIERTDTLQRMQFHRNDYMEAVARSPECPVRPSDQTSQANDWWPGTVPSKYEKMDKVEIDRLRKVT